MKDTRVAITGTGIVCALGHERRQVWDALLSGKTGIRPIEGFDSSGFGCRFAAQVSNLTAGDLGIHPRDSRIMDTHSYMLMKSAHDAFLQGGLAHAPFVGEDIGFFAGMGMVDYRIEDLLPSVLKSLDSRGDLDYASFFTDGYRDIHPLWPLSMLNNISFCQVATSLDIRGENTVFSPHADSGAQAIAEGIKTLLHEKAKVVLAGGVSEKVSPFSLARGLLSMQLNSFDDQVDYPCRPFAADRKGTVLGEGCGILTLEFYESAVNRGIPCAALITGYGSAFEPGTGGSGPAERAQGFAMKEALESSGRDPSDIDLIIAHGDGTGGGDKSEIEAIHEVFRACIERMQVYSSKGALGHLLGGAPAVDIILGISVLETGIIPPTITTSPERGILFSLVRSPLTIKPERILINSRSSEGQAASFIIEAIT